MQKNVIITLVFAIFIAVFAVMNAGKMTINLIFTEIEFSAALVIIVSAFIGAIIIYSLDALTKLKLKKIIKDLKLQNTKLQNEKDLLLIEEKQLAAKQTDKVKQKTEVSKEANSENLL